MGKGKKRNKEIHRNKVPGGDSGGNKVDSVQPDHNGSAFQIDEASCFIVHRIGPGKQYERLYGPFMDRNKAQRRLLEYVEHFIRENKIWNPRAAIKVSGESAKVEVSGMSAKGEGPAKEYFYFVVKAVQS